MFSAKSRLQEVRSSPVFIVFAICVGLFTDSITACSIIPILPAALKTQIGIDEDHVQFWIAAFMAAFSITFMIFCPFFGFLSDRLAIKKLPFVVGMGAMILSLILFMHANSIVTMMIARALQGVASSAIMVLGTAMIKETVNTEASGKGMAFSTAAGQLGLILGPAFGGLVYDKIGYKAVFILPSCLLAIDIALRLLIIEKPAPKCAQDDAESQHNPTNVNAPTETDSLLPKSTPSEPQGTVDVRTSQSQTSQTRDTKRSFPVLHLFSDGRLMVALLVSGLDCIQWGSLESTVPHFVMKRFGWTPGAAGALLLVACTPGVALSYFMGGLVDRFGPLIPAAAGVVTSGACHLAQRLVQGETQQDAILFTSLFTMGNIAMLFVVIVMSVEIGAAAERIDKSVNSGGKSVGKAYAMYMMVQSAGQLLGPIIGGAMFETRGWTGMTTLLGVLCLSAMPFILLFTGGGLVQVYSKSLKKQGE